MDRGAGVDAAVANTSRDEITRAPGETSQIPGGSGHGSWLEAGPGAELTARLVGADGRPAAGAEVRPAPGAIQSELFTPGGPTRVRDAGNPQRHPVTAGADGRIRLEVPAGESLQLEFGGTYWRPQARSLDALRPGETADLGEIALVPAARLSGRVLDASGRPISGAVARLRAADEGMFWEGHELLQSRTTDADGRVAFEGLPAGRFRIESEAIGYARGQIEALEIRTAPADASFELRLKQGATVRGRAVDADRRAVADAAIYLMRLDHGDAYWGDYLPPIPDREPDARSAADGSFTVRGLPEDVATVLLLGQAPGFATGHVAKVSAGDNVTLVMPPALTVSGRVLREGDAPVADAALQLLKQNPWGWEETVAEARSGEDGSFVLSGIQPGAFSLRASAQGATSEPLALQVDKPLADVLLRVAPRPALRIRVQDPAGRPLAGAAVDLSTSSPATAGQTFTINSTDMHVISNSSGWSGSERSDADGVATFYGAPAGELKVGVRLQDWARADEMLACTGGDQQIVVTLERPAALLVRVTDGAGAAVRGVVVKLRDPATGASGEEKRTDALGRALWSDLRAGACEILLGEGGGSPSGFFSGDVLVLSNDAEPEAPAPPAGETVLLEAGTCLERELVLHDLAIVTVHVLRAGLPAADVQVHIAPVTEGDDGQASWGGGQDQGVATDGRGDVVLPPVSAGKYRISARPGRNAPPTPIEVELLPGPQEVTVRLNGAEVRGVLRSPAGPVVGARLTLEEAKLEEEKEPDQHASVFISMVSTSGGFAMEMGDPGQMGTTASTDQDGEFVFRDVPEGQWIVKSRAEGFAPWASLPFAVSGDRAVQLPQQTLLPGGVIYGRDANWKPNPENAPWGFDWGASIRLETEAGEMVHMSQADERGEYKIGDLSEGKYVVRRGDWRSEPVSISPGSQVRVDVPVTAPPPQKPR